jgi:hypothetical protein
VGGFVTETWLVRSVWGTNGDAYVMAVFPSVAYEEDGANAIFSQTGEVLCVLVRTSCLVSIILVTSINCQFGFSSFRTTNLCHSLPYLKFYRK